MDNFKDLDKLIAEHSKQPKVEQQPVSHPMESQTVQPSPSREQLLNGLVTLYRQSGIPVTGYSDWELGKRIDLTILPKDKLSTNDLAAQPFLTAPEVDKNLLIQTSFNQTTTYQSNYVSRPRPDLLRVSDQRRSFKNSHKDPERLNQNAHHSLLGWLLKGFLK